MILTTSILMFYLRPRNDFKSDEFESILSTMYISTLILTGSSSVGDMPELPWYTKAVLLLTSAFSIGKLNQTLFASGIAKPPIHELKTHCFQRYVRDPRFHGDLGLRGRSGSVREKGTATS